MLKQLLILVLCCSWANLFAQEPIRYTTKQGLPSNHIYDIQEDANGFMWFATNRGLVKYDGETFKTFTIQEGLPNNDTWLLETDYQDQLWYFSKSKYQGYIKNDSIYKFPIEGNKVITPRFIYKSEEDFWIHSSSGIYSLKNETIKLTTSKNQSQGLAKKLNEIGKSYDFNELNSRYLLNPKTNELIVVKNKEALFFDVDYNLMDTLHTPFSYEIPNNSTPIIDNAGFLYHQTMFIAEPNGKGILLLNTKTKNNRYFSFKELVGEASVKYFRCKGLKDEIQISVPGNLLLFDYDLNFKKQYTFSKELSKQSYQDSKGNIWLSDLTNGISLLPNTQLKNTYFLKGKKVQKINKIDSLFYAGVNDVGFYQFIKGKNEFQKTCSIFGANGEIYQINKIKNNTTIFVSSSTSYKKEANELIQLEVSEPMPYSRHISFKNINFFKNHYHTISGNYLCIIDSTFNKTTNFITKDGLLTSAIFKNELFYGSSDGLFVLKKDTLVKPRRNNNLLNTSITHLFAIKDNLMVGTDGRGVYLYNENRVVHLKNTDGFSIQKIIQNNNTIWLATNNGVHQLKLNLTHLENSIITNSFYEADGLLQNNINDIYKDGNNLYAATDIGLAKLNLNNIVYKQQPNVYFNTQNDTLIYKNGERDNITITFALHNYINQEHVKYQYRLLPTQKDWVNTITKTLNFNNLSPNLYTLEVKATDQHNNQSISKQFFEVVPAWWETVLVKIGFVLLGVCSLFLLVRYIKNSIRKKEQAKAEQEKRMAGLELQALRSQMNPHFVHNSLNAIQYFIQRNEVELSENYLSKFSQLIRLFFEYSRRQTVTIKEELDLLNNYLEIEKLRFEEKLQYNISVCDNIDIEEQLIPSMLLQPIVENAVNHGLFHKKEQGNVKILFKQLEDSSYQVTVTDDGIGIKKSKHIFKASSKNYQSNSSKVLYERLDLLNRSNEWHIKYQIQDISDIDNSKTGTVVSLTFKQMYEQ